MAARVPPPSRATDGSSNGPEAPLDRRLDILRITSDRGDESIALAGQRLDELRVVGGIAQRIAQVIHRLVETAIEVDERVGRPQPPRQFFTRDELTGPLEQRQEQLQRLIAQRRPLSGISELAGVCIDGERPEAEDATGEPSGFHHLPRQEEVRSLSPGGNEHFTAKEHAGN